MRQKASVLDRGEFRQPTEFNYRRVSIATVPYHHKQPQEVRIASLQKKNPKKTVHNATKKGACFIEVEREVFVAPRHSQCIIRLRGANLLRGLRAHHGRSRSRSINQDSALCITRLLRLGRTPTEKWDSRFQISEKADQQDTCT